MASPTTTTIVLLLTIGLFAVTTSARPCKTIFFITSSTNPNHPQQTLTNSHRLTFFITEIHRPSNDAVSSKPYFPTLSDENKESDESSIDMISVVGSLLFGVGCGAVTAAVLYLIWSLCSDDHDCEIEVDSDDDVEGDVRMVKNGEYVAVASGEKEVPPTADEVEAMK